jgi:hypothetical protein
VCCDVLKHKQKPSKALQQFIINFPHKFGASNVTKFTNYKKDKMLGENVSIT